MGNRNPCAYVKSKRSWLSGAGRVNIAEKMSAGKGILHQTATCGTQKRKSRIESKMATAELVLANTAYFLFQPYLFYTTYPSSFPPVVSKIVIGHAWSLHPAHERRQPCSRPATHTYAVLNIAFPTLPILPVRNAAANQHGVNYALLRLWDTHER